MLLVGHDSVLKAALAQVPGFLPRCAAFFGLSEKACFTLLLNGGHIPDLPDIEFETLDNLTHIKGIKHSTSFLSQLLHIRKITSEVSQVMHSHLGLGSLGHSMYSILTQARGPHKMGHAIVRRCAGWLEYLSRLQRNDMRLSLLGVIMHAIIDSYAPGHTFRLTVDQLNRQPLPQCRTPVVPVVAVPPGVLLAQAILRLRQRNLPVNPTTLGEDPDLKAHFKTDKAWAAFLRRNEREVLGVMHMVQFEAALDRKGRQLVQQAGCGPTAALPSDYPVIVDFLSVQSTSLPVHHVSDWVRTLKKVGLYDFVVQDVVMLLKVFLQSLTDVPAAMRVLVCHLTHRTFNTAHAFPLRHKIDMTFVSAKYCTDFEDASAAEQKRTSEP